MSDFVRIRTIRFVCVETGELLLERIPRSVDSLQHLTQVVNGWLVSEMSLEVAWDEPNAILAHCRRVKLPERPSITPIQER